MAIALLLTFPGLVAPTTLDGGGFVAGDVFVSLHTGQVQWRHADGTLMGTLVNTVPGKAEGMGFDAALNLFVTHHCADSLCLGGNAVERFSPAGVSAGMFGSGYNCNPNSILFDADGYAYVGQADCGGDVLKLSGAGVPSGSYDAAVEARGTSWIDLGADGCTLYYTSASPKVKRYNVCAGTQLPDFALLGDIAYDLKVLPDGGVLVADNSAIVRLNSAGAVVQTYDVVSEPDLWLGLALAGDGSFWVSNYGSSNVFKIDLGTGTVQTHFNTATSFTVKEGVPVLKWV